MRFTLASLAIALVATPLVSAVDLIAYANTISCSGDSFQCGNVGNSVCCGNYPTGFGFSFQATGLPSGTQAQGYSAGGCGAFIFGLFGPGNKCWNGGGGARVVSANWFNSSRKRAVNGTSVECASPNVFAYTDNTGVQRKIKIPGATAEAAEEIAQLRMKQDFASLAKFEAHV